MVTFIYLPPYSPDLNRIEGLWKWLKQTVIYNNFLKDVKEIRKVVFEFLDLINKILISSLDMGTYV